MNQALFQMKPVSWLLILSVIISYPTEVGGEFTPAEKNHLALYLPCDNPQNPHMASLQSRIDSFRGWPAAKTKATPQQLAKAGLYYLGEADKTKCFYCNGGLQNWDYNDEPWTEHAKWFPGCAFISREKGTKFVQELSDTLPNLNRPSIRNVTPASNQEPSTSSISSHDTNTRQPLPNLNLTRIHDLQHEEFLQTLDLCKEEDRRKTFAKWPTYPAPYLPKDLAAEGFFNLGNLDRAQCFSCSGTLRYWKPSDDVKQQHQTHYPLCRLHDGADPRDIKMTAEQRARVDNENAEKLSKFHAFKRR